MPDKVDQLINILFSKTAREDERDDAAMDLGSFNDERALAALMRIASNLDEDEMILDSCGESIGEILIKREKFDSSAIETLAPIAKSAAYSFIKGMKPEWLEKP
jgi:HEAT repeat protein